MLINRRQFLGRSIALSSALVSPAFAKTASDKPRTLNLYNIHTEESLAVAYHFEEGYDSDALAQLNHMLRDHRENVVERIDPLLFDQLWRIQQTLNDTNPIEIISGFRTEKTNAMLRARSKAKGVDKKSFHLQGRAIDFRLPKVDTKEVHKVALAEAIGGVGYYPGPNFIHIDSGDVRNWAQK